MSKQLELDKLDRIIKDNNIRVLTLQNNIDLLNREIDQCERYKSNIEDNLKFLKSNNIIAIAEEFKKLKEELSRINKRLIDLLNEKNNSELALNNANKSIQDAQYSMDKLNKNSDNNILHATFGKKNG